VPKPHKPQLLCAAQMPKLFYSCTIASYSVAVITGPGGLAIGWATVPPKVERGWAV
jgi:hypothetical protein